MIILERHTVQLAASWFARRVRRSDIAKNRALVALLAVGASTLLAGCATSHGNTEGATPQATRSPQITVPAAGFILDTPRIALAWADANATFTPLQSSDLSLVSAAKAFASVSGGIASVLKTMNPAGAPMAGLYSYTNSAYGRIQADGSVTLAYTNVPVWEFSVPLIEHVDMSQGPAERNGNASNVTRSNCFYYFVVRASDGKFLTSSEECTVDVPNSSLP